MQTDDMLLFQSSLIYPAQQLGRLDKLLHIMSAFGHHLHDIFRPDYRHQPGLAVAVDGGEEDLAAGLH